jgi:hypothetical protein
MRRKLFTFCSAGSLLLCVATCALWVDSYRANCGVSLNRRGTSDEGRIVWKSFWHASVGDGRLMLLRETSSGPPRPPPSWAPPEPRGFTFVRSAKSSLHAQAETWKIQSPQWPGGGQWFVFVPLWPAAIGAAMFPTVWALRRCRPPAAGTCPVCGYDLRATPDRCPECGRAAT